MCFEVMTWVFFYQFMSVRKFKLLSGFSFLGKPIFDHGNQMCRLWTWNQSLGCDQWGGHLLLCFGYFGPAHLLLYLVTKFGSIFGAKFQFQFLQVQYPFSNKIVLIESVAQTLSLTQTRLYEICNFKWKTENIVIYSLCVYF